MGTSVRDHVVTQAPPIGKPAVERYWSKFSLLKAGEIFLDVATVACSIESSYWVYRVAHIGAQSKYPAHLVFSISIIMGLVISGLLNIAGLYKPGTSLLKVRESEIVLRISFQAFMWIVFLGWLLQVPYPRTWTLFSIVMSCFGLLLQKQLLHNFVARFHFASRVPRRALICGSGNSAKIIRQVLEHSPEIGYTPVAILSPYELGLEKDGAIGDIAIHDRTIEEYAPDLIIFTNPLREISDLLECYRREGIRFAFTPDAVLGADVRADWLEVGGILLSMEASHGADWLYEGLKRVVDLTGGVVLLALFAPLMALIAVIIRADSRGPILFRQTRVGCDGETFKMFKFRSMHPHLCGSEASPRTGSDPRITRVGRYLRKTSLDELPQLVNVIRGEMSLVGPRPEMPFIVNSYTPEQRVRLSVKPGITGLWQLSADRRFPIHDNMHYDVYYLRQRGIFLDLAILVHTVFFAVRGI